MENEPGTSSQTGDTSLYINLITANLFNGTGAHVERSVESLTQSNRDNNVQESDLLQVEDISETYELLSFSIACVLLVICIAGKNCQ